MAEDFFESPIVIEALDDIVKMQEQIITFAAFAEYATIDDQWDNLKTLRALSSKQRNMCFRCILSDDDRAKVLLNDVLEHFKESGHVIDPTNPISVFDDVERDLDDLEEKLKFAEEHGFFPGEEPGGETPPYSL